MDKLQPAKKVGEGFKKIAEQNSRDAFLYLWSERLALITGIGFVIAFAVVALFPLLSLINGTWSGLAHYVLGIALIPSPFLLILIASAWLHRRIGQKYGL